MVLRAVGSANTSTMTRYTGTPHRNPLTLIGSFHKSLASNWLPASNHSSHGLQDASFAKALCGGMEMMSETSQQITFMRLNWCCTAVSAGDCWWWGVNDLLTSKGLAGCRFIYMLYALMTTINIHKIQLFLLSCQTDLPLPRLRASAVWTVHHDRCWQCPRFFQKMAGGAWMCVRTQLKTDSFLMRMLVLLIFLLWVLALLGAFIFLSMLVVTGWTWTSTPVDHHKMVWSRQSCSKTWSWETCHQTSSVVSRNCLWKNCQQFKWLSGRRPHPDHIRFLCLHQKFESWEFWKSNSRFVGWMMQLCWATRAQNVIQMFYQLAPVVPKRSQI